MTFVDTLRSHSMLPAFDIVWQEASQQTREQWYVALTELTWPLDCPLAAPPELAHEVRHTPKNQGEALTQALSSVLHPFVVYASQRLTAAEKSHAISIYYAGRSETEFHEMWCRDWQRGIALEFCTFTQCERQGSWRTGRWTCVRCDPRTAVDGP